MQKQEISNIMIFFVTQDLDCLLYTSDAADE